MNTHPDALITASDLRRTDFLRTADRERLAAKACDQSTRPRFVAVRTLIGAIGASLSSVADSMSGTPRRALPVLQSEPC